MAQNWPKWLEQGWIDLVCPMTYGSPTGFERHVGRGSRQRLAAGDHLLMVGSGTWLHPDAISIAETIVADRKLGADGFVLFRTHRGRGMKWWPC